MMNVSPDRLLLERCADHLGLFIFALDARGCLTFLSRRAAALLGRQDGDALGKPWQEIFSSTPILHARIEAALRGDGGNWRLDFCGHTWEVRFQAERDAEGRIVTVQAIGENISQRLHRESQVRWLEREMDILGVLTLEVNRSLDPAIVLSTLRRELERQLHIPGGAVYLWDAAVGAARLHLFWNLPEAGLTAVGNFTDRWLRETAESYDSDYPATRTHALSQEDLACFPGFAEDDRYAGALALPLATREGMMGGLLLFSPDPLLLHRTYGSFFGMLGEQIAASLQNARLYQEMRESREQLQLLARRVVEARELEQGRLARELHDELGQMLTCLKMSLELADRESDTSVTERHYRLARETAGDLLARVREMSLSLRPTTLDDLGLLPAVEWHLGRYSAQTGIMVHLTHDGIAGRDFGSRVEIATYRIIQEALTNAARHAGTDQIWVDVRWEIQAGSEGIALLIEDAGKGFDREAKRLSSGLSGMRERALAVGGAFEVQSAPGEGTHIEVWLPLTGGEDEEGAVAEVSMRRPGLKDSIVVSGDAAASADGAASVSAASGDAATPSH